MVFFDDDNPTTSLREWVIRHALGAFKVYVEWVIVKTLEWAHLIRNQMF